MKLLLSQIDTGAGTQARDGIHDDVVEEYAEAMQEGATFPPIVVFHDGEKYFPGDGFHRMKAAETLGLLDIEAEVRKGGRLDALWFALSANRAHGIRPTRADVRKAIGLALQEFPDRSNREIARQIGCDHKTVESSRRQHEAGGEIPQLEERTGADGKSYPARRAQEAATPEEPPEDAEPEQGVGAEDAVPKTYRPRNGLQFSRMALMDLEQIRADDAERKEAIAEVAQWLADNAPDTAARPQKDPATTMRAAWKAAGKADRGRFLEWVYGRGSELPKGDYRTMQQAIAKLRRILKSNPKLLPDALPELREIVGGVQ